MTQSPRVPESSDDKPGRSGPDVGDAGGGEGAEFTHDATTGEGDDPDATGASYLKAHGESVDEG
ncbi:MAG TPA: hypothetical protein VFP61_13235 [Acidimicrobiales bacterium]|nr:hypothetical protein [Acidimicrobiales bacterium]